MGCHGSRLDAAGQAVTPNAPRRGPVRLKCSRLTVRSRLGLSFSEPPALRHTAGCPSGQRERSVKPSAQPTLVRTQHLPPPAKTARSLRKRGPAGRFLLVPPCVIVCRCRSSRSDRYGHIADSVPGKASGPWNRLLCRSVPVLSRYPGTRTAPSDWCLPCIPAAGSPPFCSSWAGRSCPCLRPGQAAGSARVIHHGAAEAVTECAPPVAGYRRLARAVLWPATLRVGLDAPRAALTNVAGAFPVPFSGLDLTELVVYLSWTDDVLVVDPPYTCAGNAPDHCHQAARSSCSCGERGARTAD